MSDLLVRKLEQFTKLSSDDRAALGKVTSASSRTIRHRADVIREGDAPRGVGLVLDGWACLYKALEDGRRQTLAILLPGDLCELNVMTLREMDHSIGTITALHYAEIPAADLDAVIEQHPRIAHALVWNTLVGASIQREWTLSLGQRSAIERIAHLICELFLRMRIIGLAGPDRFDCPLTQADLAEATGMTPVHVNRTLQDLRARGLIEWRGRQVVIPHWNELTSAAMFHPGYLHLDREGAHLDANG